MKTERQKMLDGELYIAADAELTEMRERARQLLHQYNQMIASPTEEKTGVLKQLLSKCSTIDIQPPFFCDYGTNIIAGDNLFMNFNCVVLDCALVTIGNNVQFGPYIQVYTATHPLVAAERIKGPELAKPITIGDNVWIGGGAIICPGVTIGENTTIGSGSVVTRDVPANVFAAGNPCRVIKNL
ncbi:sugar O-acetyltransferase [Mucilaginibacter sp. UR6-1]|uniref:sugar O-acetyltransferase n=1 Tax=Mucilaginibacter sp. UR6-1 TaxID=1435643 RepID=UPI001E4FF96C|nr:sugar O-acetyltransferase [Mucilaginibacter sp. UR6-1]MCC8407981.1 sugar O-acetyltransferase [Mucilaginibacter sp. UR6-1]